MSRTRVLLVEDHTMVRQGLRRLLETDRDLEIVGEADDGARAVEAAARLRPAVVVMDIGLPGLNGIEATAAIVRSAPAVSVLILSMHADETYVRKALTAGAKGYVLKDADDRDLIQAVKSLAGGGSYFSPAVSKMLLAGYIEESRHDPGSDALARLTAREREVLQLIAEGSTNTEIAQILAIGLNTVESHRKHLMEKLDRRNTAALVRFAVRHVIVR